jgi:hypothetical protein
LRAAVWLLVPCAVLAPPAVAFAAAPARDVAAADALFRSAKDAMAAGDVPKACAQFSESQRLDPAPGTLLNIADCEERAGKFATARSHFEEARDQLPAGDFRVAFASARIEALTSKVPRVVLRFRVAPPPSTRVAHEGSQLGMPAVGVPLPVDPGRHAFVVQSPGRADRAFEVALAAGEQRTVDLDLGEPTVQAAAASEPPHAASTARPTKVLAYALGGFGVAALATGAVTGFLTLDAAATYRDHCPAQHCADDTGRSAASTGRTLSVVSPVSLAIGAASLGAGLYLLFTNREQGAPRTALVPSFGPGAGGLALTHAF